MVKIVKVVKVVKVFNSSSNFVIEHFRRTDFHTVLIKVVIKIVRRELDEKNL